MRIRDVVKINELSINSTYPYSEIEYIDTSSVTEGRFEKFQSINLNDAPSRAKRIVRHKDILISTVRPNLKHYGIIKNPSSRTIASTGFAVITCKNVLPDYLYRLLTTTWYTDFLASIAESQQSNYPAFNPSLIANTYIQLPLLPTQRKIAAVLSAYDDLIGNNNRRIAILEKVAEELYREWFVRLRFPGHEKVKIVKGVPEGWEIKRVGEVFNTSSGGTPSRTEAKNYSGDINWFKTGELKRTYIFESEEKISRLGLESSSAKLFPKGTVVMAMYCAMADISVLANSGTTNQACCAFLPKSDYVSDIFTYYLIKHALPHMIALAHGAAQQNLSQEIIKSHKLFLPTDSLIEGFTKRANPIHDDIKYLMRENAILYKSRDRLLTRLMSGKIDLADLDVRFPESMQEDTAAHA